ncbi:MAG TPA: hypothetical protein VHC49_21230 [Mycobacteriales bacterium]|nr:hypothetical protein [Mycobacteriales bacterium]
MTYSAADAADDLDAVTDLLIATLRPLAGRDWTARAAGLEWNCLETAEHVGQVFAHYGSQVAIRAQTRYVRWAARAQQPDAPPDGFLDFVEATGRIFALVIRATPDEARIFHPYGLADPAGFAAGGCVEGLIHGQDIARGLGSELRPPAPLCERLRARLFPHYGEETASLDPWRAVQWATGRLESSGAARKWKWRATPLEEEWVITTAQPRAFVT